MLNSNSVQIKQTIKKIVRRQKWIKRMTNTDLVEVTDTVNYG